MKPTNELDLMNPIGVQNTTLGIALEQTEVDCSSIFEEVTVPPGAIGTIPTIRGPGGNKQYVLKSTNGMLDLSTPLAGLFVDREKFLPKSLFVRDSMNTVFDGLMRAPLDNRAVVFGSPGVGKSVLTFLAVLCSASLGQTASLFMRKTAQHGEKISVFWAASKGNGIVDVYFSRIVEVYAYLDHVATSMHIWGLTKKEFGSSSNYVRTFADGPKISQKLDQGGETASLVTSAGLETPHGENLRKYFLFPFSAWSLEETVLGLHAMGINISKRRIVAIYDVLGGKIRDILGVVDSVMNVSQSQQTATLKENLDWTRDQLRKMIKKDLTGKQVKVAIESTQLTGTEDNKDCVRVMFAKYKGYKAGFPDYRTVQYLGSAFLARELQSKLSLDETQQALHYARNSGIQSLYGWHFELFGHKIFQVCSEDRRNHLQSPAVAQRQDVLNFGIVQGTGTGKQSVKLLTGRLLYWMPSIPNFANIDAAIIRGDTLYCIQYTVSTKHGFNCKIFMSNFFEQLPSHVRALITVVEVFFVVPDDGNLEFKTVHIPEAQRAEFEAKIKAVDLTIAYQKEESAGDQASMEGADDDDEEEDDEDGMDIDEGKGAPGITFRWEKRSLVYSCMESPLSFVE